MDTPNYDINYDDKRFTEVESDKNAALKESDKAYDDIVAANKKTEQSMLDKIDANTKRQEDIANANTDFAIKEINQQKAQTKKDYLKEQTGAYTDYKKQVDPYGADAEKKASAGLTNTGYAESSQVSMYNQYQQRITAARESYVLAVQNYDNAITQARLQNSSALAEIAAQALAQSLEISMSFASQNNTLLTEKVKQRQTIDQNYWQRYQDVIGQINTENTLKEQARQFEATKKLQEAQLQLQRDQFNWQKSQAAKAASISKSSGGGSVKKSSGSSKKKSAPTGSGITHKQEASNNVRGLGEATEYINALIESGASKDRVANEIALALREGAITTKEAQILRNRFTPRGVQY